MSRIYWRVYRDNENKIVPVRMQWFNESEYDQYRFLTYEKFDTEEDAELFIKNFQEIISIRIVNQLEDLTDEQRLEVFSHFCKHCGCNDPKCQCWNDD
jgi:hypothetical protein